MDKDTHDRKRALGSYYTQGNCFGLTPFNEWLSKTPDGAIILEPFAGNKQIATLMAEAGHSRDWSFYDVDSTVSNVIHQDTLKRFPKGHQVVITNPPYLSYHFAKRKGLLVQKDDFHGYPSLYLVAVEQALAHAQWVAMIIPESFLTTRLFRGRLESIISLPADMFADTEMPTCLALWGPTESADFTVWRQNERIGLFNTLSVGLTSTPCAGRIVFNDKQGQVGLKAIDGTMSNSILFCSPDQIPEEKVKATARLVSRVVIPPLEHSTVEEVIVEANNILEAWRSETQDVLLTAFKGVRKDGRFRRRLDFANARAILSQAICQAERHQHSSSE